MSRQKDNIEQTFVHLCVWAFWGIVLAGAFLVGAAVLMVLGSGSAGASDVGVVADEPIIATEIQGRDDSVITGVVGDNALHLYRTDNQTVGVVGDSPVIINHFPSSPIQETSNDPFTTWNDTGPCVRCDTPDSRDD